MIPLSTKLISLIFEYSCFAWPEFDLANHFWEYCGSEMEMWRYPNRETQIKFIRTYFKSFEGQEPDEEKIATTLERIKLFTKVGGLWWTLWGHFQQKYSKIDFPYTDYANMRHNLMKYNWPLPKDHELCQKALVVYDLSGSAAE